MATVIHIQSEIDNRLDLKVNTTGNTTINGDLTIIVDLTHNGGGNSGSYTKSEIDDRLDLKIDTSLGHIYTKLKIH